MKSNITSKRMYLGLLLNSSPAQREELLKKFSVEDREKIVALLEPMPVMPTKEVRNLKSQILSIESQKAEIKKPICKVVKSREEFLIRSPMFSCENDQQVASYIKKLDGKALSIIDSYLEQTNAG